MRIKLQELKRIVQNTLFEDINTYTAPYLYVKSEVSRYLDYYHGQYFATYSEDDVKRLTDRVKTKLKQEGQFATDDEISRRVKNYLEKNTYDLFTIINRSSQFVMDSIKKDEPKEMFDFANQNKLSGANLKSFINSMAEKAVMDYIKENNYKIVNNKVIKK